MTAPQGYLTLDPDNPIILRDVSGSIVYYPPTTAGNCVPVVDSEGALQSLSILASPFASPPSLDMSGLPACSMHDIYAVDNSGFALVRVPWMDRSFVSRPLDDGVFDNNKQPVVSVNYYGLPVNATPAAGYLADGTAITIPDNRGTYLGAVCISETAGVVNCLGAYGLSREWGVWNAHQQRVIELRAGDPTLHWLTGPTQLHAGLMIGTETEYSPVMAPIFGNPDNCAKTFVGRPTKIEMRWREDAGRVCSAGHIAVLDAEIGWNSTTTSGGSGGAFDFEGGTADGIATGGATESLRTELAGPGINTAYMLVKTQGVVSGGTLAANGSIIAIGSQEDNQLLSVKWMG